MVKAATKKKAGGSKQKRASKITGYKLGNEEASSIIFGVKPAKAGTTVTANNAIEIAAVYCALTMLMNSVGSMPIHVYRELTEGGKERVKEHPVARAFGRKPNNFMTPIEFKSLVVNHVLMRGDFFAHILRTGGGEVHLIPLDPERTSVSIDEKYRLFYAYSDPSGKRIPFEQDEIFHVKGQFSDGLRGMSVIKAAREGLPRARAADEHAAEFYGNNSIPAGVLEYPQALNQTQIDQLRESWEKQHRGSGNRHRVAILEQGLKWNPLGISNTDAQWIEGRQFEIEEIARWFNVPPHKLKHLLRATFSNIEHQGKEYYEDSVLPHTRRIQEAITAKFFSGGGADEAYFAEFLFDSLLITDTLTRYLAHKHAIDSGWKTGNEVRAIENLNPIEGLDKPTRPLNVAPLGEEPNQDDEEPTTPKPDDDTQRALFSRIFEDSFGKVRAREEKKFADIAKRGTSSADVDEFCSKLEAFIPEVLDAVAISWGEAFGVSLSDVRSKLRIFAGEYRETVIAGMKSGDRPEVSGVVRQIMDRIKAR